MRASAILLSAAVVSGCATNTGVVPIGDGIYMVSEQGYGMSGGKIKAELYGQAAAYCKAQGKEPSPVSDRSQDATVFEYPSAEIKFRCK